MEVLRNTENIQRGLKSPDSTTKPIKPTNPTANANKAKTFECNFDKDPSKLYLAIQHKQWDEATERAKAYHQECKTWVSRSEDSGALRWRLLPLHAAVIFKAPEKTVQALLVSYPRAARHRDDQGMLPIHLAFRNESPVPVVQLLLMAYPAALEVQDRKGRIPLVLVQNSRSALKDGYMEALGVVQGYHAVASAAYESETIHNFRKNSAVGNMEFDAEKIKLMAKIDALESELNKTQGASGVLVNHVNSLESKLCSRHDTESYLSSKIAKLDSTLKEVTMAKELAEAQVVRQRTQYLQQNDNLKTECNDLATQLEQAGNQNNFVNEAIETELSTKNSMAVRMKYLEKDNLACRAEVLEMEGLLKSKIESEHSLATQVSTLAMRLAESTSGTCAAAGAFQKRIHILNGEKDELQKRVEFLTIKVQSVLQTLDYMAKEHENILQLSSFHQETIVTTQQHQEELAANAARNEQIMIDAAWEREEIVRILTRQAKQVEKSSEERSKLMEVVKIQSDKMSQVGFNRAELVASIEGQKVRMTRLKNDINGLRDLTSGETADLSFGSETTDDNNTITPTVVREGDENAPAKHEHDVDEGIFDDDDDDETYYEDEHEDDEDEDLLLRNASTLTSEDGLVDDEDGIIDSQNDDDNFSLSEIETSVDILCSEAARLVASMPAKKV